MGLANQSNSRPCGPHASRVSAATIELPIVLINCGESSAKRAPVSPSASLRTTGVRPFRGCRFPSLTQAPAQAPGCCLSATTELDQQELAQLVPRRMALAQFIVALSNKNLSSIDVLEIIILSAVLINHHGSYDDSRHFSPVSQKVRLSYISLPLIFIFFISKTSPFSLFVRWSNVRCFRTSSPPP